MTAAPLSMKAKDLARENVWGPGYWERAPDLSINIKWAVEAMNEPTERWPAELLNHPDVRPFVEALAALKGPFDKFLAATEFTQTETEAEHLERERADAPRVLQEAETKINILKQMMEHQANNPRDYPAEIATEEARVKRCKELLGMQ